MNTNSLFKIYKKVKIFTDGACFGNPGIGGYGIILQYKQHQKELSAGYKFTTNNRMELMAIIISLETLKTPCEIILTTDSQYVLQGSTKWINNWKKNNWNNAKKKIIKNIDLWKRLELAMRPHILWWKWIKSHTGFPENERCDKLAKTAAQHPYYEDLNE